MECALRELVEETGIEETDIQIDESFEFVHHYVVSGSRYKLERSRKKKLTIFLAELTHPVEIVPTEHPGFEWFIWQPPHDIQERTINPLLEQLAEHWLES